MVAGVFEERGVKLVYVEWRDAAGAGSDWSDVDWLEENRRTIVCRSVGWLAADTDLEIVLVPHLHPDTDDNAKSQGCGDIAIPKSAILLKREISVPVAKAARKVLRGKADG